MWGLFFFALKIALGLMAAVLLLRFLNSATWDNLLGDVLPEWPIWAQMETAVRVITGFFVGTWGLRFLDNTFMRNRIRDTLSLTKGKVNPFTIFTYPFVHEDNTHLQGNTSKLLLFAGIALLMLPSLHLFVFVTLVIVIANALGILFYGPKTSYVGASGLLLGYFGFLESFGLAVARGWQGITAVLLLLLFGPYIFRLLTNRRNTGTFIGHLWGFIAGLIATRLLAAVTIG